MSDAPPPALTPDKWNEGECESHYGRVCTSLWIDHKGRVFVQSDVDGEYVTVILNEAADADSVLPKIVSLANAALPDDSPYKITRADVALVRDGSTESPDDCNALRQLAAKLAALLPPE